MTPPATLRPLRLCRFGIQPALKVSVIPLRRPIPQLAHIVRCLAFAIPWLVAGPAHAHRPYFTQMQPILLPDGQRGEMRVIAGDGIFVADPVRLIILDAQNRLIARGPRTRWLTLVCEAPLRCHGYDHSAGEIITADPASFGRGGPVVPPMNERDDLWEIEGGDAVWGVAIHPAPWRQWLSAESAAFLTTSPLTLVFFTFLGVVAGLSFVGFRAPGRTGLQLLLWLGGLALRVTLLAAVVVVLLIVIVMGDTISSVLFGPFFVGVLLAWLLGPRIGRRLRSALVSAHPPAPPAPAP